MDDTSLRGQAVEIGRQGHHRTDQVLIIVIASRDA